jgi:hypothetical protein
MYRESKVMVNKLLVKRLIKLSESDEWYNVIREWEMIGYNDKKDECICGIYDDKIYVIKNKISNNITKLCRSCFKYININIKDSTKDDLKKCRIKLMKEIIDISVKKTWEEARYEWCVIKKTESEGTNCVCGQDIIHEYTIKNKHNNYRVIVGSTCVEQFQNIDMINQMNDFKKIECKICDKFLKDEASYKKHRKTNKHIKKQTCCNCTKKFKNRLTTYKKDYYCKNCFASEIKICSHCKSPFGKVKDIVYWKRTCPSCYHNFFKTK